MHHDFHGKRVMIVEDDYLVASDLEQAFLSANARILGPFPSMTAAAASEPATDLAVLDVDLGGEMVFPLADRLIRAAVPVVFYTGYERGLLPARFAEIGCLNKPLSTMATVSMLARSQLASPKTVADLLPQLRLHARYLLRDPAAADRLVERVLRLAVDDPAPLPAIPKVATLLEGMMNAMVAKQGGRLLH
jgi:DNA-binding response OmpR family regulator